MLVNSEISVGQLEPIVRKYRRGLVNSLLEYLILSNLEKGSMCGYDIITILHDKFRVLLSPGQVYPVIGRMSEQGIVKRRKEGRRFSLVLTPLGVSLLNAWRHELMSIQLHLDSHVVARAV